MTRLLTFGILGALLGLGLAVYAAPAHAADSLPAASVIGSGNTAVLQGALDTLGILLNQLENRLADASNPIPNKDDINVTLGDIHQSLSRIHFTIAVLEDKARAIAEEQRGQSQPSSAVAQGAPEAQGTVGGPAPSPSPPEVSGGSAGETAAVVSTFGLRKTVWPVLAAVVVVLVVLVIRRRSSPKSETQGPVPTQEPTSLLTIDEKQPMEPVQPESPL